MPLFAGIGVWSHSLRLAGWPDDRPVWTGSCPCQPFSAAGKGDGFADERHLWPHFFHLISERRPQHVFGEQVAAVVQTLGSTLYKQTTEGLGYAFGLVPFTSAGIGAPHIRERAYWVVESAGEQHQNCYRDWKKVMARKEAGRQPNLQDFAVLAAWVTPTSRDWKDSAGMTAQRDGKERLDQLPRQAFMTGWANATGQLHHQCNDGTNERGRQGSTEQNRMGGEPWAP